MTIDISPEAVEGLAAALWNEQAYGTGTPDSVIKARTPEAFADQSDALRYQFLKYAVRAFKHMQSALTASQAETAAAYELAAQVAVNRKGVGADSMPHPYDAGYLAACDDISVIIRVLTPADSKAALDRMIAEAEEKGRNIGVATEKLGRLVEWLKEDEHNVSLLPADDVEKMRAILAAIPKEINK